MRSIVLFVSFVLFMCGASSAQDHFSDIRSVFPSFRPTAYVATDFDADGYVDVVALTKPGLLGGQPRLIVALKNQMGLYFEEQSASVFSQIPTLDCRQLIAGDLNADLVEDLVCASYYGHVSVMLNVAGQYQITQIIPTVYPNSIVLLDDFDGDGLNDLVISKYSDPGTSTPTNIYRNSGNGNFVFWRQLPAVDGLASLQSGDLNGDGFADILRGSFLGGFELFYNTGQGSFTASTGLPGTGSVTAITVVDLDNDGDHDLVTGENWQNRIALYRNDGGDVWNDVSSNLPNFSLGGYVAQVVAEDFDGNGRVDIIVGSDFTAMKVFLQDANGTFADATSSWILEPVSEAAGLITEDFDQNGTPDLMVFQREADSIAFFNTGASFIDVVRTKGVPPALAVGNPKDFCSADYDGDGRMELVVVYDNGPSIVYQADLSGNFHSPQFLLGGSGSYDSEACSSADIDQDGDIDIVIGNDRQWEDDLFLNDGSGNFTPVPGAFTTHASWSRALEIADLNSDGLPDVVFIGLIQSISAIASSRVLLQQAGGGFSESLLPLGDGEWSALAVADVDSDGDLDLFAGSETSQQLLLNNGSGQFSLSAFVFPGAQGAVEAEFFDYNADGNPDLFMAAGEVGLNQLYVGDGAGGFQLLPLPDATQGSEVEILEVNGDGYPDIVVGNAYYPTVFAERVGHVYLSTPGNTYLPSVPFPSIERTAFWTMKAIDVDADGDKDILTGQSFPGGGWGDAHVYLNRLRHLEIRSTAFGGGQLHLEMDAQSVGTAYLYMSTQAPTSGVETTFGLWRLSELIPLNVSPISGTLDVFVPLPSQGVLSEVSFQALLPEGGNIKLSSAVSTPIY